MESFNEQVEEWKAQISTMRYSSNFNHLVGVLNKYLKEGETILEIGWESQNFLNS